MILQCIETTSEATGVKEAPQDLEDPGSDVGYTIADIVIWGHLLIVPPVYSPLL